MLKWDSVGTTPSGSNDSGVDDFFQGEGWNIYAQAEYRYVLPVGMGSGEPIHLPLAHGCAGTTTLAVPP